MTRRGKPATSRRAAAARWRKSTPFCNLGARAERREIADPLAVARTNVSTSLKELRGWGIVAIARISQVRSFAHERR